MSSVEKKVKLVLLFLTICFPIHTFLSTSLSVHFPCPLSPSCPLPLSCPLPPSCPLPLPVSTPLLCPPFPPSLPPPLQAGLFNFHPAVRPVQLEVHIDSFPGKHYCPRMATMNKPSYAAIQTYSPHKPILIFVSSRRQTRLTAFDLVTFLGAENNPKQWLHMDENEVGFWVAVVMRIIISERAKRMRHYY